MTAPTAVKGVVKPDYQFAGASIETWMKHWWREYRHLRRMHAAYPSVPKIYRWHEQQARAKFVALADIRRACRPVRIGGAK